jgi:uncharacterized cupredoxin-like copper-binding protein
MRKRLAAIVVIILLTGLSLAACTAYAQPAPAPTPQVHTVTVTLTDTALTASQKTVRPGVHYAFVVTNRGTVVHQFWLMPAGMAQMMKQMPMAQWHSQLLYATQDIAPGKTAKFTYTFTTATMKHSLAFGSYTPNSQTLVVPPVVISA